jgi:hypothetical protein
LYAFDPVAAAHSSTTVPFLFSATAGTWPHTDANANIVPVVANGRVYVASYKKLSIFGLPSAPNAALQEPATLVDETVISQQQAAANEHQIHGTIQTVNGLTLTVQPRTGGPIQVDATQAYQNDAVGVLYPDEPVRVLGSFDASNVLHATSIGRATETISSWPSDY